MPEDTIESRVREILADVLQLEPDGISHDASMDNIEAWDSLNHINIVYGLEEEFGVTFEIDDMEAMLSFFDVVQIVESKL